MTLSTNDVREFNWLTRYLVGKADLNSFQTWLQMWGAIAAQQTGLHGVIISGLNVVYSEPNVATRLWTMAPGFGVDITGKPLIAPDGAELFSTATYANNVKGILLLKFLGTGMTPTTTSADTGDLHTSYGVQLELVTGTPAASPVYPTVTEGLILAGYTLNALGKVTATDYSISSFPRVGIKPNNKWSNSYSNPTVIPIGTHLVHYEMTLDDDLTVEGTLVTGNLVTTGFSFVSTGGKVQVQF